MSKLLPRTVSLRDQAALNEIGSAESAEYPVSARPRTRAECEDGPRPCPFVSCRHHLYLDVTDAGSIKIARPDVPVEDMAESCSLDAADRGESGLRVIGEMLGVTRERVRMIKVRALLRVRAAGRREG